MMAWFSTLFQEQDAVDKKSQTAVFYKEGKPFKNPFVSDHKKGLLNYVMSLMGCYKDPVKKIPVPKGFYYPNTHKPTDESLPQVSWINQSTFVINIWGKTILTDPIWSERCSPSKKFGPKRILKVPYALEQIEQVDYVFISHNHYDHLDKQTVLMLNKMHPNIRWLVPLGVKRWFKKLGVKHVIELAWWQSLLFPDDKDTKVGIKVQAVPAQHFSGRYGFDTNRSLWCGWVIEIRRDEESRRIYFAGDTGYNHYDFKEIGRRCGEMDLSLIPIGAYQPRALMQKFHVNPTEAIQIHTEVHSKLSIGCHFGTFKLSVEEKKRPLFDLFMAMEARGIPFETFRALIPGQTINF